MIDAVVTWVDGNDPLHLKKRFEIINGKSDISALTIPAGVDATRFENNNEIEFCLRSLRKFAPWLRKIFLVTDQQCPKFLNNSVKENLGIEVVDHSSIFQDFENFLPTFNSLSIETALHRIPGLSEKYIYLNDDFILINPVVEGDFFTEDGEVVLRGRWLKIEEFGPFRIGFSQILNKCMKHLFGINRSMSKLQQIRGAQKVVNWDNFFKVEHTPYPMRKSTLEDFFLKNKEFFIENIKYKFRDFDQFAVTSLSNHIEIDSNKAKLKGYDDALMFCFNRDSNEKINKKFEILERGNIKFLCIQSFEQSDENQKRRMINFLKKIFFD